MTFDNHALIASELQKVLNKNQNLNLLECSQTFVSINQHICGVKSTNGPWEEKKMTKLCNNIL
jgi:hypothetical protein